MAASENVTAPYSNYRFEVVLNLNNPPQGVSNPLCNGAFAECSGLDMTMEPKTYAQGGINTEQTHRPGPVTYGRVTLQRGMTDTLHLWSWFAAAAVPGKDNKAQGEITLWDASGEPRLTFVLKDCLPVKVSAPSFNASNAQVAIEQLQIVYAALTIRPAGQSGGISLSAGVSASLSGGISASASASVGGGVSVSGGPGLSASAGVNVSGGVKIG